MSYAASKMNNGFTLLELLVAMTVFATMSIMAYGGLTNVITNSEAAEQSLERLHEVQLAIFNIERDMLQIAERNIRDELGQKKSYLEAGSDIDLLIELTRNGRRNPANLLRSHLIRVAYKLDEENLVRLTWPHLDRVQGMTANETTILTDVASAELRFLDDEDEWHLQWPPINTPSGTTAILNAIEYKITLNDWGVISRLFSVSS